MTTDAISLDVVDSNMDYGSNGQEANTAPKRKLPPPPPDNSRKRKAATSLLEGFETEETKGMSNTELQRLVLLMQLKYFEGKIQKLASSN